MTTIGQWQRFEVELQNTKQYADPYHDVTLAVDYSSPDGRTISFWGFYDGGDTWKLRFMPDQMGIWRLSARFSDGSDGLTGSFECVPSQIAGMIAVDETNPIWFGFKGGKHVLLRSLHVGDCFFASNTPAAMRTAFLDWATKQGYNMLSVGSHYLNRAEPGRGQGWDTPRLWPLAAAEFQRTEAILDDLGARGVIVFPFGGFFGRGSNFPRDAAGQERYVRYVLARWGAYWNVLFNVSGPEPLLEKDGKVVLTKPELDRLGRLIKSLDVFGHAITVHNKTGDDAFLADDWPSFGTLQGPKTVDTAVLHAGLLWNHHPAKPLYVQETLWSGNKHGHPDYSDKELRQNAYVILMSAGTLNFADNGGPDAAAGDSSSGFSGSLDLADRRQWRHDIVKMVWDFFETIPFYRLRPAPHAASTGLCLAEPGQQYLVYLPAGGATHVRVDAGTYHVVWVNAQDTADRRAGSDITDGRNLTAPSGGDDWLLYLTRA